MALTPLDKVGFTPFARSFMLDPTGYQRDYIERVYVLGSSRDQHGKRLRIEKSGTLTNVFISYINTSSATLLWVKWSDGTRRLVHRKGS